jgi:hypothetical protein
MEGFSIFQRNGKLDAYISIQNIETLLDILSKSINQMGEKSVLARTNFVAPDENSSKISHNDNAEWLGKEIKVELGKYLEDWYSSLNNDGSSKHGTNNYYVAALNMDKFCPSLLNDISIPAISKEQQKPGNIWIAHRGKFNYYLISTHSS